MSHMVNEKYHLTISRNTIDKLGVKLYDKASDVVSELISNAYDADAEVVKVTVPLGEFLATKKKGIVTSKNLKIIVEDDGHGFSEGEANIHYLKIGNDRRTDPDRGDMSREHQRPVMGRKGIGKLAVFGICRTVEVWSASGKKNDEPYPVSHFVLRYDDIMKDTDETYHPSPGAEDGSLSKKRGTRITLSDFLYKTVPDEETFRRQLARKFGMGSVDFKILVTDSNTGKEQVVSALDVDILEDTKIEVDKRPVPLKEEEGSLPVRGWIAYAKQSYRNEEMAGVRIYARGKLAATSRDFGRKAGFTGEHSIRSYMIGEIHAEWLDEEEDLIASDRQDILWSSDKGQALQEWGTKIMEELGRKSKEPLRKKTFEEFMEASKLEDIAKKRFGDTPVYHAALEVGKNLAGGILRQNLQDDTYVNGMRDLVLSVAPHKTIVDNLKNVGDWEGGALNAVATFFGDAKIAETASLGQVAQERIRAIDALEKNVRSAPPVKERDMQDLLENAPWLIDPQWTVLQANQTLRAFQQAFEEEYKRVTSKQITTTSINSGSNRPDFIMLPIGKDIEVVEIKRPKHTLNADEYERFFGYVEVMEKFLNENEEYKKVFSGIHATLVCDDLKLTGTAKSSYDGEVRRRKIQHKTWEDMLLRTKQAHVNFLNIRDNLHHESV